MTKAGAWELATLLGRSLAELVREWKMWIMCISFQDYVDPAEVLVLVEVAPRKGWIKIAYQLPSLRLTVRT